MGTSISRLVRDERKAIEEAEDNDKTHLTILMRNTKELGRAREQLRQKMESTSNAANPLRSVCFRMANVADRPVNNIHYRDSSSSEEESDEDEDEEEEVVEDNPTVDSQENQTWSSNEENTKDKPQTQDRRDEAPNSDDNQHGGKAQATEMGKEEELDDEDSDSENENEEENEDEEEGEESEDEEPPLLLLTLKDQEILKGLFYDLESAPLETIWFDFNDAAVINAGPVVSLIKQTRETLKYVSFIQVHMKQNIEDLEDAFQDHPVLEKVVVLNNNKDDVREFSVPARECVIPAVAKCPKLTEVIIEGNSVLGLEDLVSSTSLEKLLIRGLLHLGSPECNIIFDSLKRNQNTVLKQLQIDSTFRFSKLPALEEDDIQAFNEMLKTNNSIQKLWIPVEYNLLPSIAKALESNREIHYLYLNFISYKGYHKDEQPLAVQAISDMVKVNTTLEDLEHLTQDGNPWEVDGMQGKREIHWYLKLNAAGRGKLLNNMNATIEDLIHSIDYVKNCPSSIFYFLQNNPSFIVDALQKDSANRDDERPAKKRRVTAGP